MTSLDGPAAIPQSDAISPCSSHPPIASNHISIQEDHDNISGTWTIDTSLSVPSSLLKPFNQVDGDKSRPNISLHTEHGNIDASIVLVSCTRQRAVLDFSAIYSNLQVNVKFRINSQPFKLTAKGEHGSITLILPEDFIGPIRHRCEYGNVNLSETLQSRTHTFSPEVSFVGDFRTAGFIDFETWEGDEVEVESKYGKIVVCFVDEWERDGKGESRKGLFGFAAELLGLV